MRMSGSLTRTLRDDPADAEADSHRLLVRAGYIRRTAAGIYTWLPLGVRVLRRIEAIVRDEMARAGAQEVSLPILQPLELWERTGRDVSYGPLMFRLADRKETAYCLAPTAEAVVTALVAQEFGSYRDLPATLYQINWKYRAELRPQFGVLRGREFMAGASIGENDFVWCASCDYAANTEAARRAHALVPSASDVDAPPMTEVYTPELPGIDGVASFLGAEPSALLKCIAFDCDG